MCQIIKLTIIFDCCTQKNYFYFDTSVMLKKTFIANSSLVGNNFTINLFAIEKVFVELGRKLS